MASSSRVYGVSILVHGVLALAVIRMHEPQRRETIAISVAEAKNKPQEKPPEPAKVTEAPLPESKARAPRPRAHAAPAPKAEAPPPEATPHAAPSKVLDALPDLGIAMGNGGPGGIAVPQGGPAAEAPAAAARATSAPRALAPAPADVCAEPVVKPKLKSITQPAPTTAAREAQVDGRVRVEVSVGADGSVKGVRLLSGLGYGLDEASLEAVRHAVFAPATRCGKPVAATFVIALRFRSQ